MGGRAERESGGGQPKAYKHLLYSSDMKRQNDYISRLKKYIEKLDSMIQMEEMFLNKLPETRHMGDDAAISAREPIAKTIVAYKRSKTELYKLFPELND